MLKEIVQFSKELEKAGIYKAQNDEIKLFVNPVLVIPVNFSENTIDSQNSYLLMYDRDSEKTDYYTVQNRAKNEIKFKSIDASNYRSLKKKTITEIDDKWKEIIENLPILSQKIDSNSCIAAKQGTLSYSLLHFSAEINKMFKSKEEFKEKIEKTYKSENVVSSAIPESFDKKTDFVKLFCRINEQSDLIWDMIDNIINGFKKNNRNQFSEITVIFKLPDEFLGVYTSWYEDFCKKKVFAEDKPGKFIKYSETDLRYLPSVFNNVNQKKIFLRHNQRPHQLNYVTDGESAYYLYLFKKHFLKLKVSPFPLFAGQDNSLNENAIRFLKNKKEKMGFREIITEISRESSRDVLSFYIVIMQGNDLLFFDYISNFKIKFNEENEESVFTVSETINNTFLEGRLVNNFVLYWGTVNTKNSEYKYLANDDLLKNKNYIELLYKYRPLIFNFTFRGDCNAFNVKILMNMFLESLAFKLKCLFSEENYFVRLRNMKEPYLKLDKMFGGNLMTKIDEIKRDYKVNSPESFAYFAGQIAYYLLYQSEGKKTHALVEPFINVASARIVSERLLELFNKYKYKFSLGYEKFNHLFSDVMSYSVSNEFKYDKEVKTIFFIGYLSDNIFFNNQK